MGWYKSDKRLTEPQDTVGKTVARVASIYDCDQLTEYSDGTFTYMCAESGDCDAVLNRECRIQTYEARRLGLITEAEYVTWKAAEDAENAARAEAEERKRYEELKAKFEGTGKGE